MASRWSLATALASPLAAAGESEAASIRRRFAQNANFAASGRRCELECINFLQSLPAQLTETFAGVCVVIARRL